MATISTEARTALADEFAARFDRLEIRTAAGAAVIATVTLNWGAAAAGSVTCDPASVTPTAGGEAAEARLYSSADGTEEVAGLTVGTTGTDIVLTETTLTTGTDVDLSAVTYNAPSTL